MGRLNALFGNLSTPTRHPPESADKEKVMVPGCTHATFRLPRGEKTNY
jgi:hypothetical protein